MAQSSDLHMYVVLSRCPSKHHEADHFLTQSVHENRIYSVNIHCGDQYPDLPPAIQFVSRVNLPCVDQKTGKVGTIDKASQKHPLTTWAQVDPSKLPCLANWKRDYTMETILIELRRYVQRTSEGYRRLKAYTDTWLFLSTKNCHSLKKVPLSKRHTQRA